MKVESLKLNIANHYATTSPLKSHWYRQSIHYWPIESARRLRPVVPIGSCTFYSRYNFLFAETVEVNICCKFALLRI